MSREYCKVNTMGKSANLRTQNYIHEVQFIICYSFIMVREPELLFDVPQHDADPQISS